MPGMRPMASGFHCKARVLSWNVNLPGGVSERIAELDDVLREKGLFADLTTAFGKNGIQARGSAYSYGQRYLLCKFFNIIIAEEDTDGNAPQRLTDEQVLTLREMCQQTGGDPAKFILKRVSGCRAVPGTSLIVPNEHFNPKVVNTQLPVAVWLCTSGYAVGTSEGSVIELNADKVRVPISETGATTFAIRKGRKQLVTLVNTPSDASGQAEDTL